VRTPPLLLAAALALAAPALPAQTIEPVRFVDSSIGRLRVTTLYVGLQNPWSLCFLPDGRALVSERPGRLRIFDPRTGTMSAAVSGLPAVWANGQGGLLDVALDPAYNGNHRIWFSYAEVGSNGRAGTAVARARLEGTALSDVQVMFRQDPKLSTGNHFGSRLVFDRVGRLFVSLGENNVRIEAQHLDHHQGKVVRINADGTIPADNPFVATANALDEIWSSGHRNPQGAALNPWTGELWVAEHGPQGGDEINVARAGRNYGWPIITYGIDYDDSPIPESTGTSAPGMEQPLRYWVPSISPSGMAFYTGRAMPPWRGDVFVGALSGQMLVRLDVSGSTIVGEERLLQGFGWRIRDVRQGPGGALYLLTDASDGRIVRVEPDKRLRGGWDDGEPIPLPKPRR
jgi:glucose/arabinose dehydrogenase